MPGLSARKKGYRAEYSITKMLNERGINAKRIPLSGATNYQKGDINVEGHIAEVKARSSLGVWQWFKDVDFLFLKADYKDTLVVMDFDMFVEMYKAWRDANANKQQ